MEVDIDVKGCFREIPRGETVIVGGGGLLNARNKWNNNLKKIFARNRVIVWGAGFNRHYDRSVRKPLNLMDVFLLGIRDYTAKYNFVPCPSCMLPFLEDRYEVCREIGVYEHKNAPISDESLAGFERMSNKTQDVEGAIRFLGESGAVVTNTYHGAYWGLLLGKRVVLYRKFSTRFDGFPFPLAEFSGNLDRDLSRSAPAHGYLEACRKANEWFAGRVAEALSCPVSSRPFPGQPRLGSGEREDDTA